MYRLCFDFDYILHFFMLVVSEEKIERLEIDHSSAVFIELVCARVCNRSDNHKQYR